MTLELLRCVYLTSQTTKPSVCPNPIPTLTKLEQKPIERWFRTRFCPKTRKLRKYIFFKKNIYTRNCMSISTNLNSLHLSLNSFTISVLTISLPTLQQQPHWTLLRKPPLSPQLPLVFLFTIIVVMLTHNCQDATRAVMRGGRAHILRRRRWIFRLT